MSVPWRSRVSRSTPTRPGRPTRQLCSAAESHAAYFREPVGNRPFSSLACVSFVLRGLVVGLSRHQVPPIPRSDTDVHGLSAAASRLLLLRNRTMVQLRLDERVTVL